MKKIIVSLFTMAALLLPAASQAAEKTGVYVAPKFVLNVQHGEGAMSIDGYGVGSDSETEASAGGALAVGYDFSYKFNVPVRAELEYGVFGDVSKTVNHGWGPTTCEISVQTLLANVYWDITTWNKFTPYIGAGIGLAFVKTEGAIDWTVGNVSAAGSADDTEAVFAGQIGFGCSYAFTDTISADLGYRFLMMGDGEVEYEGFKMESKDLYAHQFMLGLRVTF